MLGNVVNDTVSADPTERNRNMEHPVETRRTLRIICLCGLAGILLDIDHIIAFIYYYPLPTENLNLRIFHTPVIVIVSVIILSTCAYLAGLYIKLVLRRSSR